MKVRLLKAVKYAPSNQSRCIELVESSDLGGHNGNDRDNDERRGKEGEGGGALVSCSTSTTINHNVFLQNTSCIRKPQVISGGRGRGGAHPLHPPPRSAPVYYHVCKLQTLISTT